MEALIVIAMYAGVGALVIFFGALFWLRSAGSRQTRRCPSCGEEVTTELMRASRCNTCGASLDGGGA